MSLTTSTERWGPRTSTAAKPAVLVVDDDEAIREILTEILADAHCSVLSASNGAEALEVLREVTPSLILLDLNMPVLDGVEFRKLQRKDPSAARIPTVVMSAVHQMGERIAGLEFDAALEKPVKLGDLLGIVERYCGGGGGA